MQELFRQYRVARQFAHHNQAQAVFAAFQTVFLQCLNHRFGFAQSADERNHDFDVGQTHFVSDAFKGFAFEREAVFEAFGDITRRTTEAQHRVFFVRFVNAAADQVGVFVGFEVGHTDDGFTRINRCGQCCHAFGDFIDVEVDRGGVAGDAAGNFRFQFIVLFVKFQQGFRVDADLAVDDEFHACQADAFARQVGEAECEFGVADVHHDFNRRFGHIVQGNVGDLYVQQAGIDEACIAFGTRYGNFLTVAQ